MAGTLAGGKAAAATNKARDPDFYRKIGSLGGKNGTTGGFYVHRELAKLAGAKGGSISSNAKLTPEQIETMVRLRRQDPKTWTLHALSKEFSISHSAVYNYLRKQRKLAAISAAQDE